MPFFQRSSVSLIDNLQIRDWFFYDVRVLRPKSVSKGMALMPNRMIKLFLVVLLFHGAV